MARWGQLAVGCSATPRHVVVRNNQHECDPEYDNSDSVVCDAEDVQSSARLVEELVSATVEEAELVHRSQEEEVPEVDNS